MTVGDSKAAMMIKHPALAPSPQPRPAPTVRALPAELAVQRGPSWMPIRGPNPTPIDNPGFALQGESNAGSGKPGPAATGQCASPANAEATAPQQYGSFFYLFGSIG